jgi:uridine kinase
MTRQNLLSELVERITRVTRSHPVRVAIDGVDAAGKTTLADELVAPLERAGRVVIRASIDGFHNPSAVRCQRGRPSPEGYFRDSVNDPQLMETLLTPLGPGGDRRYRRASSTSALTGPSKLGWRRRVTMRCCCSTASSCCARSSGPIGISRSSSGRILVPGQQLYLAEVHPERHASVVVDHNDVPHPRLGDL